MDGLVSNEASRLKCRDLAARPRQQRQTPPSQTDEHKLRTGRAKPPRGRPELERLRGTLWPDERKRLTQPAPGQDDAMAAIACTPRGVIGRTATDGPRKRSEPALADFIRALPSMCGTTIGSLTLALSGRPQALQARGRRKIGGAPDARPRGYWAGPLERVVRRPGHSQFHLKMAMTLMTIARAAKMTETRLFSLFRRSSMSARIS